MTTHTRDTQHLLLSAQKPLDMKGLSKKTVTVDSRVWLPRSGHEANDEEQFWLFRDHVNSLVANDITPVVVFEGKGLPYNASQDRSLEQTCRLAKWLDDTSVRHITAPCEADAQLAHLQKAKVSDAVMTSAPLAGRLFSAGCPSVLLTDFANNVTCVSLDDLRSAGQVDFSQWSPMKLENLFFVLCCLREALPSLPETDLAKTCELVDSCPTWRSMLSHWPDLDANMVTTYEKVIRSLIVAKKHQDVITTLPGAESTQGNDAARQPGASSRSSVLKKRKFVSKSAPSSPHHPSCNTPLREISEETRRVKRRMSDSKVRYKDSKYDITGEPTLFSLYDNKENIPPWARRVRRKPTSDGFPPHRSPPMVAASVLGDNSAPVETTAETYGGETFEALPQSVKRKHTQDVTAGPSQKRRVVVETQVSNGKAPSAVKPKGLSESSNRLPTA